MYLFSKSVWKFSRLRNPILFGMGVAVVFNYGFNYYEPAPQGHWLLNNIEDSI